MERRHSRLSSFFVDPHFNADLYVLLFLLGWSVIKMLFRGFLRISFDNFFLQRRDIIPMLIVGIKFLAFRLSYGFFRLMVYGFEDIVELIAIQLSGNSIFQFYNAIFEMGRIIQINHRIITWNSSIHDRLRRKGPGS